MFTHVSQGTSVVVARPDDSSDVVVNIKRLPHREGGKRCNRPILAKYIGGSRNCIWGASRASVERRGKMAHFECILAVNVKFYSIYKTVKIHQNPADTSEYDAIKRGKQ